MSYIKLPERTSYDLNSAADINQLTENIEWIKNNIIDIVYPIGCFYVQYPDAYSNDLSISFPSSKSPASLFGGTWEKQFDTEGVFFRTEGDPYSEGQNHLRKNGKQKDSNKIHHHSIRSGTADTGHAIGLASSPTTNITGRGTANKQYLEYNDGTNPFISDVGDSLEARPLNRLVRIWKRIG